MPGVISGRNTAEIMGILGGMIVILPLNFILTTKDGKTVIDDSDPHLRWFKLAKNVSKYSEHRIKVGAVLIRKGKPISVGFNKRKAPNRKFITRFDTTHAEICALATSGKDEIKKSIMFVYREDKKGNVRMSRPCEYCMDELKKFGIKQIYYSTNVFPFWSMEII